MIRGGFAVALALMALSSPAIAEQADCYDVKVYGRPIAQIPTEMPGCEDCIIMSWPWFLDLEVERVWGEGVRPGVVTVLSVQHTQFRVRYQTWYLRRHKAGGFNLVGFGHERLERCPAGTYPVRPYVSPREGGTYDDLRRVGMKAWQNSED